MKSVLGADPFILFDSNSGYYYSYCTGGDEKGAFRIYKSKDMVEWEFVSLAILPKINIIGFFSTR